MHCTMIYNTDVELVLWKWFWNVCHYQWSSIYSQMFQMMSCDVKKVLSKQATSNWCTNIPLFICYCVGSITRQHFIYLITIVRYEGYWLLKRNSLYLYLIKYNYPLSDDYQIWIPLVLSTLICVTWNSKEDAHQNDNIEITGLHFLGPVREGPVGW